MAAEGAEPLLLGGCLGSARHRSHEAPGYQPVMTIVMGKTWGK